MGNNVEAQAIAAELEAHKRKVLDVVARTQLGSGRPALVQHVLQEFPNDKAALVETAIATLNASDFVERTREKTGPGLQLTPLGLLACRQAGEAAAFAVRLLDWLKMRARLPGRKFTEYSWDELRKTPVAREDGDFFLAVTAIQVLELSDGVDLVESPPSATWTVPSDLSDLRGADDIVALRLRAQRRRATRQAHGHMSLTADELVARAEAFEARGKAAVVDGLAELERRRGEANRKSEAAAVQAELDELLRSIEAKDQLILKLQSQASEPATAQALEEAKEDRQHKRTLELKLLELDKDIRVAEIHASAATRVAGDTTAVTVQGQAQRDVAKIQGRSRIWTALIGFASALIGGAVGIGGTLLVKSTRDPAPPARDGADAAADAAIVTDCMPANCNVQGAAAHQRGEVAKAISLYTKACFGGIGLGCVRLGDIFERGEGVARRNDLLAAGLYQQACDAKEPIGCTDLGGAFRDGRGVAKDLYRAREILGATCKDGFAKACEELAALPTLR